MKSQRTQSRSLEEFEEIMKEATGWVIEYFKHPQDYPVLSKARPGDIIKSFPKSPPRTGRSYRDILSDFKNSIVPGITHWNHPSFFAYFAITGSCPGILGEFLTAALNVNGMLWKTSPALTELEELSLGYLKSMLGIDESFFGMILDTASTSSLLAVAAAREALDEFQIREKGMAGRPDIPPLVLYTSEHSHSSIEKAAIVLGIGRNNVRKIRVNSNFQMSPEALKKAIHNDKNQHMRPFCVVATVGTTSTTSVDPVEKIAAICGENNLWLHVDAAYAGMAAILPEMKDTLAGCDMSDSIVVNPHKWLATPIDLSAFFCKKPEVLKRAFALVPEYLKTSEGSEVTNLMDYGFQLGRRFRALKLWMVINYYGTEGLQSMLRGHIELAREFENFLRRSRFFEIMAPVTFSTVCFRLNPFGKRGVRKQSPLRSERQNIDELNERFLENVNKTGRAFLSHTKINDYFTLRCAIGNINTTRDHIKALETLLTEQAQRILK